MYYRHSGCSSGGRPVQRGSSKLSTCNRKMSSSNPLQFYHLCYLDRPHCPAANRPRPVDHWWPPSVEGSPLYRLPSSQPLRPPSAAALPWDTMSSVRVPSLKDFTFPKRHVVRQAPGPRCCGQQVGEVRPTHLVRSQLSGKSKGWDFLQKCVKIVTRPELCCARYPHWILHDGASSEKDNWWRINQYVSLHFPPTFL